MLQRLLVPILLAGALAAPAAADDGSRYSEWRPDGAEAEGGAALEALARELEALIDEAENARAAESALPPGPARQDRGPRRRFRAA